MARYLGATCRLSRRYGKDLEFKTRDLETKCKMNSAPGLHGQRRRRETDYGKQLAAKQAIRMKYGMLERPFRKLYLEATRMQGATGVILLQLLESRLDNLVFRMGFSATRKEARQIVTHKGVLVDGQAVNIPSYIVKAGSKISIREKARSQLRIQDAIKRVETHETVDWVEVDYKKMEGEYKRIPDREDLPSDINEQLVVELYSK
ncbi:MAG TPA: 30S ribosomal protein S4 [Gammaproteobacteria bacterium]|nr:30S ribosomal protein S4 [Gammaproteobacteria bacterium]